MSKEATQQRAESAAVVDAPIAADMAPQQALQVALQAGCRTPEDFARLLQRHPAVTGAMMHALQTAKGNAFAQQVVQAMQGDGAERGGAAGTFLSPAARDKTLRDTGERIIGARMSYVAAITELKVAEMIKQEGESSVFASLVIGVVMGNFSAAILGAMKTLKTVEGAKRALEAAGERASSELLKSAMGSVAEKELESTVGTVLDVAKDQLKESFKPGKQPDVEADDPEAGRQTEDKDAAQSYLTSVETGGQAMFQNLAEQVPDKLNDTDLLAFCNAMDSHYHTVEIYKSRIKRDLDRYMTSEARNIGRRNIDAPDERNDIRETMVAWIDYPSGKRLIYVRRDFDASDVEDAGVAGNDAYAGARAVSYSNKVLTRQQLDRFIGFVEPSLVETALRRHEATWREAPREYQPEMFSQLMGFDNPERPQRNHSPNVGNKI